MACREAIRLKSDLLTARLNLGNAICAQHNYKEAEGVYREIICCEPNFPGAHCALGNALFGQRRYREAEMACREAVRLKPNYPMAHYNLGNALAMQGKLQESVAAYREAIRLKPDYAEAHCNLGDVLRDQGYFADALESFRRGHALGSKVAGWPYPSAQWVRQCDNLLELDHRLSAIRQGDTKPAGAADNLHLASFCLRYKHLPAAAVRFYATAFADPRFVEDPRTGHRYRAAQAAALAATGQGEDTSRLDDKERARLRKQALDWLRADLAAISKLADNSPPQVRQLVGPALQHWQQNPNLASLREKDALANLPDGERGEWLKVWADVEALRKRSREAK